MGRICYNMASNHYTMKANDMNTEIKRSIISAQTLAPIVAGLLKSELNFLVWSKQYVEMYDGMVEAVTQAGFHVVAIKNMESIHYCHINNSPVRMINNSAMEQVANDIKVAKSAGKRVAVMFTDVECFSPRDCHFLVMALSDNIVANVALNEQDVIFAIGNMNDKGKPDFPDSLKYNNTSFDILSNRFLNYIYE